MVATLDLLAFICLVLYLADIGPNETQVLLAGIAAVSSLVNVLYNRRNTAERRQYQAQVKDAIQNQGLVAMVPEQVVKDVQAAQAPPPAPGDQAP